MTRTRQNPFKRLRKVLQTGDDRELMEYARGQLRSLSYLTALTYDPDPDLVWAAIRALGLVAAELADRDPEFVRGHLRRLVWLLNDESGGIGWRAPEALGVILAGRPDCFADFIPILVSLLDMEAEDATRFQAGYLWAIGRLAQSAPEPAYLALPRVLEVLGEPDPQLQGLALWCLGQFPALPGLPRQQISVLEQDPRVVKIYTGAGWMTSSLAELARAVLSRSP